MYPRALPLQISKYATAAGCRPRRARRDAHTGWAKKVNPKRSTHKFVKYWPILKILSLL